MYAEGYANGKLSGSGGGGWPKEAQELKTLAILEGRRKGHKKYGKFV